MDFPMNMFRDQLSKIASPRIPVQTDNCCREGKNQVVLKAEALLLTQSKPRGIEIGQSCSLQTELRGS